MLYFGYWYISILFSCRMNLFTVMNIGIDAKDIICQGHISAVASHCLTTREEDLSMLMTVRLTLRSSRSIISWTCPLVGPCNNTTASGTIISWNTETGSTMLSLLKGWLTHIIKCFFSPFLFFFFFLIFWSAANDLTHMTFNTKKLTVPRLLRKIVTTDISADRWDKLELN